MSGKEKWEDWMGKLKYPISKNELLDKRLGKLIRLMNVEGKMYTIGSCLHDFGISFLVEDENWFLKVILPKITSLPYYVQVRKIYDDYGRGERLYRRKDNFGNHYYWILNGHSAVSNKKGKYSEWKVSRLIHLLEGIFKVG